MFKPVDTRAARARRHRRIRVTLSGTTQRPRLNVFRSLQHIYAQVTDDTSGTTVAAASTLGAEATGTKTDRARSVGKAIAERAREKGISTVVFDRGGYLYHGRIKALAEAAREAGLEF